MSTLVRGWDWAIIITYLLVVVGIGVAAGFLRRQGGEGSHYFLASDRRCLQPAGSAINVCMCDTAPSAPLRLCVIALNPNRNDIQARTVLTQRRKDAKTQRANRRALRTVALAKLRS